MKTNLDKVFKSCGFSCVDEEILSDINKIINWQEILQSVDTDGVEPMYSTLGDVEFIYNEDIALQNNDKIFTNAPDVEDNFFVVPKVVVK